MLQRLKNSHNACKRGLYAEKITSSFLRNQWFPGFGKTQKSSHPRPHSPVHETEDPSALLHLVRPPEAGALSAAGKYLHIGIVLYGMALYIGLPKKTGFVAMSSTQEALQETGSCFTSHWNTRGFWYPGHSIQAPNEALRLFWGFFFRSLGV